MSEYSFPILDVKSIVRIIAESFPEIGFTESDFSKPTKDRWQRFYMHVLQSLAKVMPDQLNQHQLTTTYALQYPELHEESSLLFTVVLAMQSVMVACGVEDFQIKDIISPKLKRSVRIVSALINFLIFKDARVAEYDKIKEESEALIEQRNLLASENKELQQQINTIRASRAEQECEINTLTDAIEQLHAKMAEDKMMSDALQKGINDIKTGISEKKSAMAQLKENMVTIKAESNRLSGQIVQSPERMKKEQSRMTAHLEQLKKVKEEKVDRLMEVQKQKEKRDEVENYCVQGVKLLTGISTEIEREREVMHEISNIRDQVQSHRDTLNELCAKDQQLKRLINAKQDKMAKMALQHSKKQAATRETLEQLQTEKEQYMQIQNDDDAKVKEINMKWQLVQGEEARLAAQQTALRQESQALYSELLEQIDSYHVVLGNKWEETQQKLHQ